MTVRETEGRQKKDNKKSEEDYKNIPSPKRRGLETFPEIRTQI